jgi:phage tail protein X
MPVADDVPETESVPSTDASEDDAHGEDGHGDDSSHGEDAGQVRDGHGEGSEHAGDGHGDDAGHGEEAAHEDARHGEEAAHDGEHAGEPSHGGDGPPETEAAPQGIGSGLFDFLGDAGEAPASDRPDVVVVNQGGQPTTSAIDRILPLGPRPGLRNAIPLGFVAILCVVLATVFRRSARDLRSSGIIPQVLRTSEVVFRLLAAAFGIAAIGALVPPALSPALPVVIVAAAIAAGWSARDVLQDLVAGVFLGVEGQLRAGHWVRGEKYSGTVEAMGLRVTWLRDVYGRRIVVPNRVLLAQPLVADDNPWPRIQFTVAMPSDASTRTVRAALEEAILVSPWVAPTPDVEVHPDGIDPGHWHIAVRLLDSQYADRFQGLLRERVEEILP